MTKHAKPATGRLRRSWGRLGAFLWKPYPGLKAEPAPPSDDTITWTVPADMSFDVPRPPGRQKPRLSWRPKATWSST